MADTSKYTGPTLIGDLAIDCTVTETHTATATVTEHPVESGSNITDHIRPEPVQLAVTGIITNSPIGTRQTQRVINAGGAVVGVAASLIAEQAQNAVNAAALITTLLTAPKTSIGYAETAWKKLEGYRQTAKPIRVVTRDRTYESMAMLSLTVPKTAKTGDALEFSATFKEVRIVENRTTRRVVAKAPKSHKKTDTGKQPTAKQTPERYRSILDSTTGDESISKAQNYIRSFGGG